MDMVRLFARYSVLLDFHSQFSREIDLQHLIFHSNIGHPIRRYKDCKFETNLGLGHTRQKKKRTKKVSILK